MNVDGVGLTEVEINCDKVTSDVDAFESTCDESGADGAMRAFLEASLPPLTAALLRHLTLLFEPLPHCIINTFHFCFTYYLSISYCIITFTSREIVKIDRFSLKKIKNSTFNAIFSAHDTSRDSALHLLSYFNFLLKYHH